jgi:hypothetical protein
MIDERILYTAPYGTMSKASQDFPPATSEETTTGESRRLSRRRFGRHAAIAAAFSWSPGPLIAALHHSRRLANETFELTPEQTQNVETKLAGIIRKYGSRLSEDQRKHLRRILNYNERMLASVRAFPVQNGDSPASVLKISFASKTSATSEHRHSRQGGKL